MSKRAIVLIYLLGLVSVVIATFSFAYDLGQRGAVAHPQKITGDNNTSDDNSQTFTMQPGKVLTLEPGATPCKVTKEIVSFTDGDQEEITIISCRSVRP